MTDICFEIGSESHSMWINLFVFFFLNEFANENNLKLPIDRYENQMKICIRTDLHSNIVDVIGVRSFDIESNILFHSIFLFI